jgi:hypothetical protein
MQILIGVAPLLIFIEVLLGIALVPRFSRGECDFRHLYVSGYMVRTGQARDLYDAQNQLRLQTTLVSPAAGGVVLIRPAYIALLFVPFSLAPFRAAYFLWLTINLCLLTIAAILMSTRHGETSLAMLFLAFVPISIALFDGQDTLVLLVLLAGAFGSLNEDREMRAGIFLAMGLFKFQIVLPIALLFVMWRRWRVVGGFSLAAVILAGISFGLVGASGMRNFASSLWAVHSRVHYEVMPNLHGFVTAIFGGNSGLNRSLIIVLSLLVILWASTRSPIRGQALLVAIAVATLVSYYLNIHDASILMLPVSVLIQRGGWQAWTALAVFVSPAVAIFALSETHWMVVPIVALAIASVVGGGPSKLDATC